MGAEVRELGGLHIIGTERHEARRIDLQLRGRCGRQGDPGSSRFYPLARRRPDANLRRRMGQEHAHPAWACKKARPSKAGMVSRRVEGAQKKVEERNFEIRKNLLEYDEVMDEQRKRVYGYRQRILDGVNCKQLLLDMIDRADRPPSGSSSWPRTTAPERSPNGLAGTWASNSTRATSAVLISTPPSGWPRTRPSGSPKAQIFDAIDENLPEGEEEAGLELGSLDQARQHPLEAELSRSRSEARSAANNWPKRCWARPMKSSEGVDLSEGASFCEKITASRPPAVGCNYKFGIRARSGEDGQRRAGGVQRHLVRKKAAEVYEESEIEYPVMAGLQHFTSRDANGQKRYDRERLVAWARERFDVDSGSRRPEKPAARRNPRFADRT